MNYERLAFTAAVKQLRQDNGSRNIYERMEHLASTSQLRSQEAVFIELRDSFYMATISESGYPYIQYKGGPKGFLKD